MQIEVRRYLTWRLFSLLYKRYTLTSGWTCGGQNKFKKRQSVFCEARPILHLPLHHHGKSYDLSEIGNALIVENKINVKWKLTGLLHALKINQISFKASLYVICSFNLT